MITFIKTLRYETNPKETDVFEYLTLLGLQKIDPASTANSFLTLDADVIFYSPLKRVATTIRLPKHKKITAVKKDALKEIVFDLEKLCSKQEYQKYKSKIVRRRFKEAFIQDALPVKRAFIFREIKDILRLCLIYQEATVAIVSHSFRLKIMEAFIKTKGKIISNPALIHTYIFDDQKTYEFGEGFTIDTKDLQFLR